MDFGMPLDETMMTQRAIRRLKPKPVDDEIVLILQMAAPQLYDPVSCRA